jgi:hypothetical protein
MVQLLAAKDNAKVSWDTIKTMRVGVDRVRKARRQKLRKDFDNLAFKSGENAEEFSIRVSSLVTELQSLGDTTSELDGVSMILRVVPKRYAQMACSIETLLDLKELTIEELSGCLAASEGCGEPDQDAGGHLLLTEEEWRARAASRQHGSKGSGSGGKQNKNARTAAARTRCAAAAARPRTTSAATVAKRGIGPAIAARRRGMRRRKLTLSRKKATLT